MGDLSAPLWKQLIAAGITNAERVEEQRRQRPSPLSAADLAAGVPAQLFCPLCSKPNSLNAARTGCTNCHFELSVDRDLIAPVRNPFARVLAGEPDPEHAVYVETPRCLVVQDAFPLSVVYLQAIPRQPLADLRALDRRHVELLEEMHAAGRRAAIARVAAHPLLSAVASADDVEAAIICGFNFPVAVAHLHLHVVLPPFFHSQHLRTFLPPRFQPFDEVLRALREHGSWRPASGM